MKTTLIAIGLGYLGYLIYTRYKLAASRATNVAPAGSPVSENKSWPSTASGENSANRYDGNTSSTGTDQVTFDRKIESQMSRGEGMTDEEKVGIND